MMRRQICSLREKFGAVLLWLLWAHVPVMGLIAMLRGQPLAVVMLASAALVACYHIAWRVQGMAPITWYVSAIALIGQPALLVFLFHGHPWQMDMHMYFFAALALLIGWFDRRPILLAAVAIALHHVILFYLMEWAVFQSGATLSRVGLHAVIVMFQAGVLVWISDLLASVFHEIARMQDVSVATNHALDQRRREAEEANSAKSIFLANMSHEIRTPLNAVLGFCQLLQRTGLDARQQDYVAKIGNSGDALLRLINDILDFSKNEAGKLVLEEKSFDPRKTVELQADYLIPVAYEKRITLQIDTSRAPSAIIGDELRFAQVVLNLLGNAVKFTEEGGVVVTLCEASDIDGRPRLHLRVSDTGIGISAAQQEKLFTSFTQADTTTTRRFGGTGLGLAISRQIIEQMGGKITVESQEWHGSTFMVDLPLKVDEAWNWQNSLGILKNLRMLCVDAAAEPRDLLADKLRKYGIAVETAGSAQQAFEMIRAADQAAAGFDFVLVEWQMPDCDGIELGRLVQTDERVSRKPKLVLLVGCATELLYETIEPDLFAANLVKPVEMKSLVARVAGLVDQKPALPREVVHPKRDIRGQRLLLVEDNPINREIALALLDDFGFVVDIAEDGREACAKVAANGLQYSAVLMDVQMPFMDGIEATREIRRRYRADELPVIAMTAHAYAQERNRCLDAGMVDHITKPIDHQQLLETLHRHMLMREPPVQKLPRLDIDDALLRLSGRKELLHKLWLNFAEQYHDVDTILHDLLQQGDLGEAHRICHNGKAVAGSLGLPVLSETMARLETLLKEGLAQEAAALLRKLDQDMCLALDAISRTWLDLSAELLSDRLRQLLEKQSSVAWLVMRQLAYGSGWEEDDLQAHPVVKALDAADFETALYEFKRLDLASRKTVS